MSQSGCRSGRSRSRASRQHDRDERCVGRPQADAERPRQQSVLGELRQRPGCARQRLQRAVEHVEDHEPDRGRCRSSAEQRREVGPSTLGEIVERDRAGPRTPSQTTGSATKYSVAIAALAHIARGTFRSGSRVSPTWQAAASNAGAANPIRYRPAIALVTVRRCPSNGMTRSKVVAWCQSTLPKQNRARSPRERQGSRR